jgi:hypothetical protein
MYSSPSLAERGARLPWNGNQNFAELRLLIGEAWRGLQRLATRYGQVVNALYQFCNSARLPRIKLAG